MKSKAMHCIICTLARERSRHQLPTLGETNQHHGFVVQYPIIVGQFLSKKNKTAEAWHTYRNEAVGAIRTTRRDYFSFLLSPADGSKKF